MVGFGERVRDAELRQDDDGTVHGGPQPQNVSMPPECASLAREGEVVDITLPRLDRTLGDICWTVSPPGAKLPDSVPNSSSPTIINCSYYSIVNKNLVQVAYQWMETLYLTWLTTLTKTVSSSLAYRVGPGKFPFTVTIGFVEHKRLVFFKTTCHIND